MTKKRWPYAEIELMTMRLKAQRFYRLATKAQYCRSYNYDVMTLQTYLILMVNLPWPSSKG